LARVIALSITIAAALAPTAFASPGTRAVCSHGENRCFAHVRMDTAGGGLVPQDLWSAYQIDPNISTTPTVAIVDAYGYAALESDLAAYRSAFGLPACTRASGCLTIVNEQGATSPLPANPPASDDWTLETALDVDMVSAVCPRCKILVVQASSTSGQDLYPAQVAAANAKPAESGDMTGLESYFDHPGIAQFVSGGDSGYDNSGAGPNYPSTSAHVIAVGGTSLYSDGSSRGWSEQAWTMGGSSCSNSIAKPSYQGNTSCAHRAATDISAVGDPETGVAIYNAANGGWLVIGGTSAAAPIVASIFAATGNGGATSAQIAQAAGSVLFDVTSGTNGSCGNILCNAGAGWDGPTGYGTPSAAALGGGMPPPPPPSGLTVAISSPADGSKVSEQFQITATATGATVVGAFVDGVLVGKSSTAPYTFVAPHMPAGAHVVQVVALDASNAQAQAMANVTVDEPIPTGEDDGGGTMGGGCATGGSSGLLLALAVSLVVVRRRARATRARRVAS
jgi:subtilase family serine protease